MLTQARTACLYLTRGQTKYTLFPYTTLFRSGRDHFGRESSTAFANAVRTFAGSGAPDRKSTRLNSSHVRISYAVFCLKKKSVASIMDKTNLSKLQQVFEIMRHMLTPAQTAGQ